MTRRLGGFRRRGFPALASLSLVSALACGGAITGCGGDDNGGGGNTIEDGGGDASETGTPAKDAGADAKSTADAGLDSGTAVVDSGTAVVDSGTTVVDSGTAVVDSGTEETPDTGVDSGEQTGPTDSGVHDSGVDSSTGVGPIDSGLDSGTITDSGHGGSTVDANDAAAGPTASFSTSTLNLGPGNCGGTAASTTYTIANTGGSTLNITNAAVTGNVFSVAPATLAIPAGQSGHLTVSATVPQNSTANVALTTQLTFTTNDTAHASGSVTASVLPTGVTLAWATGSPTSASFGLQPEGAVAAPINLTLANTGNASVTVGFGSVSLPFTLTPSTSGVLAGSGGTVGLTAGFDPLDTQNRTISSTFSLPSGTAVCGTSVGSLALSGQGGSGSVTGWPSSFDFGPTACGTFPAQTSFTLTNTGTLPVTITSVTASGSTTFTTDATTSSVIPPNGGTLVVNVNGPAIPAAPSSISAVFSGSLSFTTDAFDDTTAHVVTFTEEPLGAILAFDTLGNNNFGNFGAEPATTSTPVQYNVVNTGNQPATVEIGLNG
ncbi:MAG TPA: hypothetical protein VK841_20595, partial [Polyangiaceae bacterium]|nr:hypothetical protein [Polyangiaceae bacterium]